MFNSPQHKLAKCCVTVIKPLEIYYSMYNVKYSFSFAEEIVYLKIKEENISFCSFYIKSLFTSLPIDGIKLCVKELCNLRLAPKHLNQEFFSNYLSYPVLELNSVLIIRCTNESMEYRWDRPWDQYFQIYLWVFMNINSYLNSLLYTTNAM